MSRDIIYKTFYVSLDAMFDAQSVIVDEDFKRVDITLNVNNYGSTGKFRIWSINADKTDNVLYEEKVDKGDIKIQLFDVKKGTYYLRLFKLDEGAIGATAHGWGLSQADVDAENALKDTNNNINTGINTGKDNTNQTIAAGTQIVNVAISNDFNNLKSQLDSMSYDVSTSISTAGLNSANNVDKAVVDIKGSLDSIETVLEGVTKATIDTIQNPLKALKESADYWLKDISDSIYSVLDNLTYSIQEVFKFALPLLMDALGTVLEKVILGLIGAFDNWLFEEELQERPR